MSSSKWETPNIEELFRRRDQQHEQTTSGNAGGYEAPLGAPLRAPGPTPPYKNVPESTKPRLKKKRPE